MLFLILLLMISILLLILCSQKCGYLILDNDILTPLFIFYTHLTLQNIIILLIYNIL